MKAEAIHLLKKPLKTDLNDPVKNKNLWGALTEAGEEDTILMIATGVRLIRGDSFMALVNDRDERVDYYVSIKEFNIHGRPAVFQSLVWRNRASIFVKARDGYASFASFVFFEYLLPQKGFIIVSDNEQTEAGQSFWLLRLSEAFDKGYRAYVVQTKKNNQVVGEIPDFASVAPIVDKIWGDKKHHLRIIISKEAAFDTKKIKT